MDEVTAFLQDEVSEAAEFSSCIYNMPNWELARWAGAIRGLVSLSGRCSATSRTSRSSARRRRPVEGGEQAQLLVRVGRFGNGLVRQQLAELSWRASGLAGPDCRVLRRVGSAGAAEFQSFQVHSEALGVADNFGQNDFEGPSQVLVVKGKRALCVLVGKGKAEPVDLEQLACPSASACGMMGPYIVAVLAEAGARVLWPVHSRGCPVCALLAT